MSRKHTPNRLLTDAFREIRNTRSRFLSLFLLSALAVAFLAGLRTTAPDMEYTADNYYDRTHLMDVRVLSTLGLTEEDIAALAAAPGVKTAEGAWFVDATVHADQNDFVVRLHSLSEAGINTPELLEGRLPQAADECVVEPDLLPAAGLSIGDVLSLDMTGTSYEDSLRGERFTIVGTVNSSLYLSADRGTSTIGTGRLTAVAFLPRSAFDLDYYTEAYLLADGAEELLCYSDTYKNQLTALTDTLEPLGEERSTLRYEGVVDEANDALQEAQEKFHDAEAEAEQQLSDAEAELDSARRELDSGWSDYYSGRNKLSRETASAMRDIEDAEKTLADSLAELEQGEADYLSGAQKLADSRLEYEDGLAKYEEGLQTLADGEAEYEANRQTLADAQADYDQGLADYEAGIAQYEQGVKALEEAKLALDAAKVQLSGSSAALASGQAQLTAAKNQADALRAGYSGLTDVFGTPALPATISAAAAAPETVFPAVQALQTALLGVQAQMDPATQDYQTLTFLLSAFPADSGALQAMALAGAEGMSPILGGYAALGTACDKADAQVAAAQAQLNSASAALASGQAQYAAGLQEYEEGLAKLEESKAQLEEAKLTLDSAAAELEEGWAQLAEGRQTLDDAAAELEEAHTQLLEAEQLLQDGELELQDARTQLDDGWTQYNDGQAQLQEAKSTLVRETNRAQRELSDAYQKLNDGEAEYASGLQKYEDAQAETEEKLSDARRELNDARREISEIENCKWYILGRNTNTGYVSYQQDAQRMGNLASVFPLIFFLVAALVCLTTMTRMVEEQRVQIGSLKALGYSRGAIALKYVGYGFLASFGGGLVGLAIGCTLLPTIIFNAWKVMYTVGDLKISFFPGISLLAVGAAVFCVTGTALAASFAALSSVPASLMRPRAPQPGKRVLLERITPLWKRLSFTRKVSIRNLFRYKKRFWMTVIGIGGCTALLITGFGLRDSVHAIFSKQYDELTTYHGQVSLAEDVTYDELTEITRALDRHSAVESWTSISSSAVTAESDKRSMDSYVYLFAVTDESKFGQFVHLRDRRTGEPIPLTAAGAVITEKLAEELGVKVGDAITLVDGDDRRIPVPITGIAENYVFHYIYLSHDAYLAIYGHEPPVNSIMTRYTEDTVENSDAVGSVLIPLSGVSSLSRTDTLRESVLQGLQGVDYAVVVVVISAAALAFVVLYNLTNINITERLRELATLKVLGFHDRELSAYVGRENVFLTFFGILLGLVMGKYLHQWLVLTVEIDMAMFGRTAEPLSYVFSVLLTVLFSILVNLAARLRLRKIDMVESLKTVE